MASSSAGSIAPPSGTAFSASALSAHEALPRLRSAQEAAAPAVSAQEALAQLASAHEASAQLAADQAASAHEASAQEASAQEAFAFAVAAQLAASKTSAPVVLSLTRNWFSALFGFGGLFISIQRPAFTSPTPSERLAALGRGLAPFMSAPFT